MRDNLAFGKCVLRRCETGKLSGKKADACDPVVNWPQAQRKTILPRKMETAQVIPKGKEDKLLSYKRSLMLLNADADYVFQNSNGEVIDTLADELPYDLNSDIIKIEDKDYGVFFIDSYDQKERYNGKKVNLNAVCYLQADGTVVIGRLAMTCCENDIQLLGFFTDIKESFKANEWINLTAIVKYEVIEDEEEPVLKVVEYNKIKQIKDPVVTL